MLMLLNDSSMFEGRAALFGENFLWVQIFSFSTSSSYFSSCLYVFVSFPGGSDGKESACNVGDLGSVPG